MAQEVKAWKEIKVIWFNSQQRKIRDRLKKALPYVRDAVAVFKSDGRFAYSGNISVAREITTLMSQIRSELDKIKFTF